MLTLQNFGLGCLSSLLSGCQLPIPRKFDVHPDRLPKKRSDSIDGVFVPRSILIQAHHVDQCDAEVVPMGQYFAKSLALAVFDLGSYQVDIEPLVYHI